MFHLNEKWGEKVGHLNWISVFLENKNVKTVFRSTQLILFSTSFVIKRTATHCMHVRLVHYISTIVINEKDIE